MYYLKSRSFYLSTQESEKEYCKKIEKIYIYLGRSVLRNQVGSRRDSLGTTLDIKAMAFFQVNLPKTSLVDVCAQKRGPASTTGEQPKLCPGAPGEGVVGNTKPGQLQRWSKDYPASVLT